jgi:hypothetical protein
MVQHSGFYGRDDSYYPANSNSSTPKNRQLVPKVMPANPTKVGYMGVRLWFVRRFGAFGGRRLGTGQPSPLPTDRLHQNVSPRSA